MRPDGENPTSAATSFSTTISQNLPSGHSAAEAWDVICRGMGIVPLTENEAAKLPPWTEEEADAFERTIYDAFE